MRGLIVKDLMFFRTSWKNLLITLIGTLLLSIALGNYYAVVCIVPLYIASSAINTFQLEEYNNCLPYIMSLPLSRKEIVRSKYLFTLIIAGISTFIGLLIYTLVHFIINPGIDGLNINMIYSLLLLEASSLLIDAIFFPIIYKYGCEKSRLVIISLLMFLLGFGSIISVAINVYQIFTVDWTAVITFLQTNGVIILLVSTVVLFILSYLLSVKIFTKKDY